jgi:pimeloyl-ACP methyl ester carboxylesterase
MASNVSLVVTLVHGTWARGAPWTQLDSPFCNQLREELTNHSAASVKFFRIDWSGGNSHRDRRIASIALRKQLLAQLQALPHARHYVVAHSHGGNVALRAVHNSPTLIRELSGIVAIATPFLRFTKQHFLLALLLPTLRETLSVIIYSLSFIVRMAVVAIISFWPNFILSFLFAATLVYFFSDYWIAVLNSYHLRLMQRVLAVLMCGGFALLFLYLGWQKAQGKSTNLLENQASRILRRYSCFQPEARLADTRVFVMSSLLDEAYAVLIGSWWMHRVTGWGVRLGISAAIALSLALDAAVGYGMSLVMEALSLYGLALQQGIDEIVVLICFTLPIILAYVLVKIFLVISGRSSPALGLLDPADNLVCDVRARRTLPAPIQMTSKRYAIWQLIRHARGVLFHSRIYFHRPAIADIAMWMSSEQHGPVRKCKLDQMSAAERQRSGGHVV